MLRFCPHCQRDVATSFDATRGNALICSICGSILRSENSLPAGAIISGFQIESEIGRGGMGVVYRAKQMNLERPVALKVMSDELSKSGSFVERFFREARAAASLSHPGIVQAYDAGATPDGIYYFAMELVEGETLDTRISRSGALPVKEALEIARRVADALNYAWERQRLSHGDIKPENIILSHGGGAKLADLGLAKSLHEESSEHDLMATPLYAPPELIKGDVDRPGLKSDMYSFGATLYHMLSGSPPFPGSKPDEVFAKHLNDRHQPLSERSKEINSALSSLVDSLLDKTPDKRPASWADIVKSLDKAHDVEHKVFRVHSTHATLSHHPKTGSTQALKDIPAKEGAAPRMVYAVGGVAVLLIVAAALYFALTMEGGKPSSVSVDAPSPRERQDEAWIALKPKLSSMSPGNAVEELQAFVKKWQPDVVPEAVEYLEGLQKSLSEAELSAAFRKKLDGLLSELKDPKLPAKGVEDLKKFCARIEAILKESQSKPFLAAILTSEKRDELSRRFLDLSAAITKKTQDEDARQKAEAAKKDKERLAAEQRKQQDEAKKRKDALTKNQSMDEFYSLVGSCFEQGALKKPAADFRDDISSWIEKYKGSAPADLMAAAMFLRTLADGLALHPPEEIFIENESFVKDLPLPGDVAPGFIVESIDSKSLKLTQEDGKVKIGKKLLWSQFKPESFDALLKERLLGKGDRLSKLKPKEQETVFAWLLLRRDDASLGAALENSPLKANERQRWLDCAKLLASAPKEMKAVSAWEDMKRRMELKDYSKAASMLVDIANSYPDTLFYQRYASEIKPLLERFKPLSPDAMAKDAIERVKSSIEKKDSLAALNAASSACARYAFLEKMDRLLKAELLDMREKSLGMVRAASQVKSPSDNKIPFYFWEYEAPGDAWVYKQVLVSGGLLKPGSPVSGLLTLASDLDAGIWDGAKAELLDRQNLNFVPRLMGGPLKNWLPSLLFGLGIAADRYQSPVAQAEIAKTLKDILPNYEGPMKPLSISLAMEYSLMARMPGSVAAIAKGYQLPQDPHEAKLAFRLLVLQMLAMTQADNLPSPEFKALLDEAAKRFGGKESPYSNDLEICRLSFAIASLDCAKLDDGDIRRISSPLVSPDACGRLLMDSLSRAYFMGDAPTADFDALLAAISSKVSGNLASAELFERILVFKLTRTSTFKEMASTIDEALADPRICAMPFGPRLLALRSAVLVASKNASKETASSLYSSFIVGCPLASDSELQFQSLLNPESAEKSVSKLLFSNSPKAAFWAAATAMLLNFDNPAFFQQMEKLMQNSGTFLTWEEKSFLKMLRHKTP